MDTKIIYMPLLNDIVFKYIFGYNKNIKYTEYLLELLFNLEPGSLKGKIEIINSFKLDKISFIERGFEVDIRIRWPRNMLTTTRIYDIMNLINYKDY